MVIDRARNVVSLSSKHGAFLFRILDKNLKILRFRFRKKARQAPHAAPPAEVSSCQVQSRPQHLEGGATRAAGTAPARGALEYGTVGERLHCETVVQLSS